MDGHLIPSGAGGGKSGAAAAAPFEAPNTLRTRMTARVLYLISEGQIGGLVDGQRSIFLNDTPIQAADGSTNLQAEVSFLVGTADQPALDGFPTVETPFTGPGLVRQVDPPPVRSLDLTGRDRWSINITIRSLYQVDGNNNVNPHSVAFRIEWRIGVGAWTTAWEGEIVGKCVAPYIRQFSFAAPHSGVIDIRVTRLSPDPPDSKTASEFEWSAHAAITDQKMIYPGVAYCGLRYDAEKFPTLPTATFEVNGIGIEVPTNYNPTTRAYSGVWDGTFQRVWSDNPAWVFWTLATNPTFGAGTALAAGLVSPTSAYAAAAALVDKWTLYSIAQYCDEMVPDGFGGLEPRYTINAWINSPDEAYRLLNAIASVFRGMIYWGRGQIVPVIDRPTDPVKLVTPANVIDGLFRYEGTALRARHSVVRVRWRDPAQGYREAVEVVEDGALMQEVGVRVIDYEAIGCTKRSMARRMGRWILYTEKYESGTVSYAASADHITAMPGDVILVQDPKLAGVEYSGRLGRPPVTTTQFVLDRPVTFSSGVTYSLRVVMMDGAISAVLPITNAPGTTNTVNTSLAPAAGVLADAVWIITASNVAPVPYRVLAVEEADDQIFNVIALRHYPGKYGFIEQGLDLNDDPWTIIQDPYRPLTPPSGLAVEEYLSGVGTTALVRVVFSWTPATLDNRVRAYEAQALQGGVAIQTANTDASTVTFPDLVPGSYSFRVRSLGNNGQTGAWVTLGPVNVDGVSDPPGTPTGVVVTSGIRQISLNWTRPSSRFLRGIEVWATGTGFNNASDTPTGSLPAAPSLGAFTKIAEVSGTGYVHDGLLPSHVWHYYLRSIDVFGTVGTWVGPFSVRTSRLIAADIADGIINTAKFAAGIAPVNLIPNLSATGAENDVAYNTTDGRLYKRTGGSWVPLVSDATFSGQLTAAQIASVNAASITGLIASAQIDTLAAAKLAGEIVAAQISNNAVIASKIAAGAVTTAKLSVASTNLIWNSCCTGDTAGWTFSGTGFGAWGVASGWRLKNHGTGYVTRSGVMNTSTWVYANWEDIPVTAGGRYQAAALIQTHRCTGQIFINWYDAAGASVGQTFGDLGTLQSGAGETESAYVRVTALANAPAGATVGRLVLGGRGTGESDPYLMFTKALFGPVPPNATEVGAWVPGGVTSISGGQIVTRSIIADRIVAGSITAAEIAASAITADKIAANSITASKIAAGEVTAEKLAANSITSDKLVANSVIFGKVAAGAIRSAEIFAGEIRAVHMAAETILTQTAQIGDAIITTAKIGLAQIDELRIAGDAITTYGVLGWNGYIMPNELGAGPPVVNTFTINSPSARPGLMFNLIWGDVDGVTWPITYLYLNGNLVQVLQASVGSIRDWVSINLIAGTNTVEALTWKTNTGSGGFRGVQCTILGRAR